MPKELTYAQTGVDRELRARSKQALTSLRNTYKYCKYGQLIQLPYGTIVPMDERYIDFVIEGIGTKVLLAQLANKYDTIGIDGVAMAVNDVIRSGATPLAVVDNIHTQVSDPRLVSALIKGIEKGAIEARCPVPSGEIGDVADLIKGVKKDRGFDIVVACLGELLEEDVIYGNNIEPGDVLIGLRSSGVHSNGISLVRKVLFKKWGGKYGALTIPDGFDREIIYEVLEPTRIYVKPLLAVAKKVAIKGAVHITGDAYLKLNRLMTTSKGIGFEINNFDPQPIFNLIQRTASEIPKARRIQDEEMLKTFNMGWGFAIVVNRRDQEGAITSIEKNGIRAEKIGTVTSNQEIVVKFNNKKIRLAP